MDLFNYISKTINPEIAAQMASSVAWRIDTMLQQSARTLLKEIKPTLSHSGIDEYNDLESTVLAEAMNDFTSRSMATSAATGPIGLIQSLSKFRDPAHELARDLTNLTFDKDGNGREYEIPDLDDVFFSPIELRVKPETIRRATKSAQRSANAYGLSQEQTEKKIARMIARKEEKAKDTSKYLNEQQGTVHTLYRMALTTPLSSREADGHDFVAPTKFDELPKQVQLTLMLAARDGANRLAEWAQDYGWLTEKEFEDIDSCAVKVDTHLNRHINELQNHPEVVEV